MFTLISVLLPVLPKAALIDCYKYLEHLQTLNNFKTKILNVISYLFIFCVFLQTEYVNTSETSFYAYDNN